MADWTSTFGDKIQTKDGLKDTKDVLTGKKVVGIYFSAHWCPPCRQFTPVLGTVDRDDAGFNEYFASMPFTALPFANRAKKDELAGKFGVSSIPMLIFLNANGDIITKEGRNLVAGAQGNIDKIWDGLTS